MGSNRSIRRHLDENFIKRAPFLQSAIRTQKQTGKLNSKEVRVLIVDDEEDMCEVLAGVLRENGYMTDTTLTVSEAVKKMKGVRYNLMITDIKLPDKSGIELLELVEKISPGTAVIILTAFPEAATAIQALNHGAFSYLTKPSSNQELLSVVDRATEKQCLFIRRMQLLERFRRKSEKFQKLSFTDKLTGLYNRTYLEEILTREEMRFKRYKRPVAIVMVDINDLKQINDHFGHLKGDEFIKETAKLLQNTCRSSDIVARYGGDEFIILLPETTEEGAFYLINSLRKAVRQWNLSYSHQGLTLNLAFGFGSIQNGGSLIDAINEADTNMYRDKIRQKALDSYQRTQTLTSPPIASNTIGDFRNEPSIQNDVDM
jgi:diguanylate cyclase (GGDEF)-like protein